MRIVLGLAWVFLFGCSNGAGGGKRVADGSSGGVAGSDGPRGGTGGNGSSLQGSGATDGAQGGATAAGGADGSSTIALPEVYPPVRAATPTALIADSSFAASAFRRGLSTSPFGTARQALAAAINLATALQERFYSPGPTNLLRIVSEMDGRMQGLDLTVAAHPCLSAPPIAHTYALPGGQSFTVKLHCLQRFGAPGAGSGWVGFGFERLPGSDAGVIEAASSADASSPTDAGGDAARAPAAAADGLDFYLVEGQEGGNGGAYHIDPQGDVEGWLAVAERDIPANSQVIMRLWTKRAARTLELAIAGSGVGFCAAHVKTDPELVFVSGKTNAPPEPGTLPMPGVQNCDATRSGCFRADDLGTDLGGDSPSCALIGPSSFDIGVELDSDITAAGANVVPAEIYQYFSEMPTGVPDF